MYKIKNFNKNFRAVGGKGCRKKKKRRVSKEGIKSSSTESITIAIWLNAIFARSLKIICQTAYHDFRQWITVGIPLCNRGRLLTALSLSHLFLSPPPSRQSLVISFLSQGSSSRKQTLFPQRSTSRIILHASAKNRYLLEALLYTF